MNSVVIGFHEKSLVKADSPQLGDVELRHPASDSSRVELFIPRRVERVREIDPFAIPTDLHHLRSAMERFIRFGGVSRLPHNASNPHRTRLLGMEGIRDIVLLQFARAPAGDVKKAIVEGEIDVGNQRGNRLETLKERRKKLRIGRFGGNLDNLLNLILRFVCATAKLKR